MDHEGDFEKWSRSRIVPNLWRCGSKCNCIKAEILEVTPDRLKGYPWVLERIIWEGLMFPFPSYRDAKEAMEQLQAGCKKYGINIQKDI